MDKAKQLVLETELLAESFGWKLHGDRVALKRVESESISKGGIIIPDSAQETAQEGVIVAMGEEITTSEENGLRKAFIPFHIGQRVKFGKYAGIEQKGEDGLEYIVMRSGDIISSFPKS